MRHMTATARPAAQVSLRDAHLVSQAGFTHSIPLPH